MPVWIAASLFAALMQCGRFLLQRHLKVTRLSTTATTWVRFVYSLPLILTGLAVWLIWSGDPLPALSPGFAAYASAGALAQILGTAATVALFTSRNFAVGIAFAKTEVIATAALGFMILNDTLSWAGGLSILLGFIGVGVLAYAPGAGTASHQRLARLWRQAAYGVGAGVSFGLSAVFYRGATLSIEHPHVVIAAAVTLLTATLIQTLALLFWIYFREHAELRRVLKAWRFGIATGVTSALGSLGWFTAFALQNAALVKAVGQSELVFSLLVSAFWLRERISRLEMVGMAIVTFSIMLVLWAGKI